VDLDELLSQSDYVSVHCPLTRQSRKMVGAAQFAKMKPDAYFITTARGFIHDEDALAEALRARQRSRRGSSIQRSRRCTGNAPRALWASHLPTDRTPMPVSSKSG
jgi:hypothetical protein